MRSASLRAGWLALLLLWAGAACGAIHQDHLVSGGGKAASAEIQVTWAAVGEPLGGRMEGGGFVILLGGGVPGSGPLKITRLTPADKSRFYQGAAVSISVTASGGDHPPLAYRFLLDGRILQDWSTAATATWNTRSGSFGWHIVRAEVRDEESAASQEIRLFLFRRPPQ